MKVVFKYRIDPVSGLDLIDLCIEEDTQGYVVKECLDPWTVKTIKDVLTKLDIPMEDRQSENLSKVFN